MSNAYATKLAEGFSQKLLLEMYDRSLIDSIVNRDYQGEVNGVGSTLNILNFDRISERNYTGANLAAADDIYENNTQLVIDQKKSFYWKENTIDKWASYIKEPKSTIMAQKADERNKNMDAFVLAKYSDVGAGNRVGTDYTTGLASVAATTGVVTGNGTTFTADMVGRGIKFAGEAQWYRVKTFNGATEIVIEDDKDDTTSAYTGGAVAETTYVIEAATVLTITTANLLSKVALLKQKLDKAESYGKSSVPDSDRWLIVPPEFETVLVQASGVALHVPAVYEDLVKKGFITMLQGFKVFKSNRLTGNNEDGFRILAGHSNWMTFAEKLLEVGIEDLIGNFGKAYKDLFVYGAKVTDSRRHFAAEGYWKFA